MLLQEACGIIYTTANKLIIKSKELHPVYWNIDLHRIDM